VGAWVLGGLGTLVVIRFLFGAGEAGAYPNITRALHNWFPVREWALAQGCVWMSGRFMGGLTPLVWALLVSGTSWTWPVTTWRGAFFVFSVIGLAWCAVFALWFRNRPEGHPGVNEAERLWIASEQRPGAGHGAIPWRSFFASRSLWFLCVMYFCITYGWYFNITYLPSYMKDRFALDDDSVLGALYKGGPLWVGAAGCLAGGFAAEWLSRRLGNRRRGRRVMGVTSLALCAFCWFEARAATSVHAFFLLVSTAAFCNDLTMGPAWATCQDIGRRYAAVTAAWMNTAGTCGAAVAGWLTGALVDWSLAGRAAAMQLPLEELSSADQRLATLAGYRDGFLTYAAVYVLAALCWCIIDPTEPIAE
jgi:MFS family permease